MSVQDWVLSAYHNSCEYRDQQKKTSCTCSAAGFPFTNVRSCSFWDFNLQGNLAAKRVQFGFFRWSWCSYELWAWLVSSCFEPSQRVISQLKTNTNLNLFPGYSTGKSQNHNNLFYHKDSLSRQFTQRPLKHTSYYVEHTIFSHGVKNSSRAY